MKEQLKLLSKDLEHCDIVIILDACRCDYFRKYSKIDCECVISPASYTLGWLKVVSPLFQRYEFVAISSHPYINSKGDVLGHGYDARPYFKYIVDLWNFYYDKSIGTVHPVHVYNTFKKMFNMLKKFKMLIWFLQPHLPPATRSLYQYFKCDYNDIDIVKLIERGVLKDSDYVEMYIENLQLVLDYTYKILDYCRDRKEVVGKREINVLITSDHGEFLGEEIELNGKKVKVFSHPGNISHPILRTVPYALVSL
ncbi:hypothetical protein DRJ17_04000 [Candidatus Woesearchaeota archaeon]|nr:MAG: hypothetical protein DRJ17_04000 [Candidatus Woesearchaeota archaeon]